jgi:hypothetical protein
MTALAMIIGMIPMALGLGRGREQNAPLGRAVIGGLMFRDRGDPVLRADRVHDIAFRGDYPCLNNPRPTSRTRDCAARFDATR